MVARSDRATVKRARFAFTTPPRWSSDLRRPPATGRSSRGKMRATLRRSIARLLREAAHARRRDERRAVARPPASAASSRRSATTTASSRSFAEVKRCSTSAPSARSSTRSPRPTARSCSSRRAAPGAASGRPGGGCLYDYAAHPLDLLTWYLGADRVVSGSRARQHLLRRDRRRGRTARSTSPTAARPAVGRTGRTSPQRKMTTKVTHLGHRAAGSTPTARRSRSTCATPPRCPRATSAGWNVRYTTELTERRRVLPARRGVQRPARRLRPAGRGRGSATASTRFATAARTDRRHRHDPARRASVRHDRARTVDGRAGHAPRHDPRTTRSIRRCRGARR